MEGEDPDSLPVNYKSFQVVQGTEWCVEEKKFQIKAKLQLLFPIPSAEVCFKKLDTDGGGSLDRSEISRGLRNNGIWLIPDELVAVLDWLDQDGGGEVELDELEASEHGDELQCLEPSANIDGETTGTQGERLGCTKMELRE